ncbi:unnamed protein product [Rotaria sordida]|uniref:Uncharacterized protein n=2 Tax=Rotaria sordida TaxID=392033 RepID=A0A814A4P0_9BILA|nr:unnamed protein product [Rotaria sordida]CAF0919319.1 unnamed protein product [Rotaria sordida]
MVSTVIRCFVFILFSLTVRVKSQFCNGIAQYNRCSPNSACACFHIAGAIDIGICADEFVDCSELVACESSTNLCREPNHRCVHHHRCHNLPVCYPVPSFNRQLCPLIATMNTTTASTITTTMPTTTTTQQPFYPLRGSSIDIHPNARWQQNGITVAGGNREGNGINQLSEPLGLYVDDDQTIYVADTSNHRIVEWKSGAKSGQVVAGGNGEGSGDHQLFYPNDVIVDKERDSLIISDSSNRRVVRWPRRNGTSGETIISNISCWGLTMDENGSLYVVENGNHEVRRYRRGETQGIVVAGGNGRGIRLNQLSYPRYVFVDRDHSVYVSDWNNYRVMKWMEGAKEGIVVAGGQGEGNGLTQLSSPRGVVVDQLGTVYVADLGNDRIMRWPKGATQGSVIVGGNGEGGQPNQLHRPIGLSFDRDGNLYVVDWGNHRVQKFNIESNK